MTGRTLRSQKQRALLYYAQDGKCAICGLPLPDGWHADHIVPWFVRQDTNIHRMQALCPKCNWGKGIKVLRKHQEELREIAADIRNGMTDASNILIHVTPGGGKSALPLILSKELAEPLGYKICWVVPRDALRKQGERGFVSTFMRKLIGHNGQIRASGNVANPGRGNIGYVTTYQAIAANPQLHEDEFRLRPYILFLDECHHVPYKGSESEEAAYYAALEPMVQRAKLCVFASGTLERHDGARIAFLPYKPTINGEVPHAFGVEGWRFVYYSRTDALEERAIVPLHFHIMDGRARWLDPRSGTERTVLSIAESKMRDQSAIIQTILETEYAHTLLDRVCQHWQEHKRHSYAAAKLLIVAPNIAVAKHYVKYLREHGYVADIATSDDSPLARKNIARFKGTGHSSRVLDILVTVGMAYEGLDVPEITHVACLTNIRSRPWLEQCFCRGNRTNAGKTHGYIFVPDDVTMNRIIKAIEAEQQAVVITWPKSPNQPPGSSGGARDILRPEPIDGDVTRARAHGIEDGTQADYNETAMIEQAMKQVGMGGISVIQCKQFMAMMGAGVVPNSPSAPDYQENVLTPSELEEKLRRSIDRTIGRAAQGDGERKHQINTQVRRRFGPREEANVQGLQLILRWLDEEYGGVRS